MSYLVLARKWRPTRFDDVVGQQHITQTLQNAIRRDRVPHALLFIGSRGIGKTSCARIFAKALNCLSSDQPVPTPCDECTSCLSVNQGNAVDVFEIDGASNNGVEQVRELRESTRFSPSISRFKIYIIDEVHMLSVGAFNALLKTLEEPPAHVKFIFATTEPHKIPDTIISRCQRFDFKRIGSKDIVDALERICSAEGITAERAALEHVAREAQGGMRDSLSLLDQLISFCGEEITESKTREIFGLTSREMMLSLVSALIRQDAAEVLTLINNHADAGADLKRLSSELLELLRDLMIIKVHPTPQKVLNIPPSELEASLIVADQLQVGAIHQIFQTLIKKADDIQRSAHPKLLLEMTLLQMCHQVDVATVSEVMGGLLSLEQHLNQIGLNAGLPPLAPPPQFRPPNIPISTSSSMPTNTEPKSEGFNKAQSTPTEIAPKLEQSSTKGRPPKAIPPKSLHNTDRTHTIESSTETPNTPEVIEEYQLPQFSRSQDGLPKHPPLPADPQKAPLRGEGCTDAFYEWIIVFNRWLSKQDSFIGSEMRLKLRYVSYLHQNQKVHSVWAGPEKLISLFQSEKETICQQLALAASEKLNLSLQPEQIELEFKVITDEDERYQLESLSEYAKQKIALTAIQQVQDSMQNEYVKQHLDFLGGQVVYVVPQILA